MQECQRLLLPGAPLRRGGMALGVSRCGPRSFPACLKLCAMHAPCGDCLRGVVLAHALSPNPARVTERGAGGHGWARHAAQQVGSLAELPPGLRGRGGPVVLQFCAGVQLLAHARVVAGEGRVLRNHGGVLGELSGCRPVSLPLTLTGSAAGRNLRLDSHQPRLCAARSGRC